MVQGVIGMAIIAALAGAASAASSPRDESQRLVGEAMAALRRGEEAGTDDEKLAAYHQGLELAQKAVEIDDSNADAHFAVFAHTGRVLWVSSPVPNPWKLYRLRKSLDRTLELNPDHADALSARGHMYRQTPRLLGGDIQKAEADLTRSIALDDGMVAARIELARIYADSGRRQEAIALLEQARAMAIDKRSASQQAESEALLRQVKAAH
jgi:tetratricopeptide (TPR) repeat protein